jgi:KaiC/GvpD/RAD55 family RecA-like ATPase
VQGEPHQRDTAGAATKAERAQIPTGDARKRSQEADVDGVRVLDRRSVVHGVRAVAVVLHIRLHRHTVRVLDADLELVAASGAVLVR